MSILPIMLKQLENEDLNIKSIKSHNNHKTNKKKKRTKKRMRCNYTTGKKK